MQIRLSYTQRDQRADEDVMQYLDALENLRNQAIPKESSVDRRYEILQRFKESATRIFANLCLLCMHMRTIWKTQRLSKKSDLPHSNTCAHLVPTEGKRHSFQTIITVNRCSNCNQDKFHNLMLCLHQLTIRHLCRIPTQSRYWYNLCPANESRKPPINHHRTRILLTTDRALHASNMVTSPEIVPTGMVPKYFARPTNRSTR